MQNENELVMEPMVSMKEKVNKVSKTLTMNEKRVMYGILSFLVIVNRDGILDDVKTQELMEHLPIFGTVAEKKAYLSQEMFDMKQIETDILKPMILEHNQKKKEEKKQEKKKGKSSVKTDEGKEVKEKKKRVNKKKEKVVEEVKEGEEVKEKKKRVNKKKEKVVEEVKEGEEVKGEEVKEKKKRVNKKKEEVKEGEEVKGEEVKGEEVKEKKRGRKTKEQIVECKVDVNVNEGNSQEDQLAELVNQLTDPRDIGVDDLETILSNLEEGEEGEEKKLPETPRLSDPVPVPVTKEKEKVQKKKAPKKNKD